MAQGVAHDPAFWRAGAISITSVMLVVLAFLTVDSMQAISAGGSHVPAYSVINREIGYAYDSKAGYDAPVIGGDQLLFGRRYTEAEAHALIDKGKLVIQSRACMDCHTFFGNGAYYAPDLTKAWLDPVWADLWTSMTGQKTREDAMVAFLMNPDKYPTWSRIMPNLRISRDEAVAVVAYLKWMSAIDANGFPANFGLIRTTTGGGQPPPSTPLLGPQAKATGTPAASMAELLAAGSTTYSSTCAACHQTNGLGVPGTFPPLAGGVAFPSSEALHEPLEKRGFYKDGKIVLGTVKEHLNIVLNGIPGTAMPGFGSQMDDATIAALVTYERNSFGNHTGDLVRPADVKAARNGH